MKEAIEYFTHNYPKENIKQIAEKFNIKYKTFCNLLKKEGLTNSERGKSITCSRPKVVYTSDSNFFEGETAKSYYWAGFIAADGNIARKTRILTLGLARKDEHHLQQFKSDINFIGPIRQGDTRGFGYSVMTVNNPKLVNTLQRKFNITPKKSLTLTFPTLSKEFVNFFILGYIDGDGTIGLHKSRNGNKVLRISMIGTKEFLEGVAKALDIKCCLYKAGNVYKLEYSNGNARKLFEGMYKLNAPKLSRKWTQEVYEYCQNFKSINNRFDKKKVEQLFKLLQTKTPKEAAKIMGCTLANIYFKKRNQYYLYLAKQADEGVEDVETCN